MNQPNALPQKEGTGRKWRAMGLFSVIAFVSLFVFFTRVRPLYVFDLDDWLYIYYNRHGFPDITEWNPARVLPETFMPLVSYIGAYLIYPLTGDYIQALCCAYGFVTALMITLYVLAAAYAVRKRFGTGDGVLAILSALFLLGHFLPFLVSDTGNKHLFYAYDVTCIFYYILSALLNYMLCCWFLTRENRAGEQSLLGRGVVILLVYLAILSNLFTSIVLMALFGIELLLALIGDVRAHHKASGKWISRALIKDYVGRHYPRIGAILFWLLSMVFEISGERAAIAPSGMDLYGAVRAFLDSLRGLNPVFVGSVLAVNLGALGLGLYRFRKEREGKFLYWQLEMACCMILSVVYLILVSAKVNPGYIARSDVMISWMGFGMFMTLLSLAYLVKNLPKIQLVLPLLLFVLFFEVVTAYPAFANHFEFGGGAVTAKAIMDDMVDQVLEAEEAGENRVEVRIPASLVGTWPLDVPHMSDRLPKALYYHNMTQTHMQVTIVPDPEKDVQFSIGE